MPTGKHWLLFLYVNIAFVVYAVGIFYYGQLATIKANWPVYRCNPMYMPLADDIESNFVYCVQNMQTSYMGTLLEPITYVTNTLGTTLGAFSNDIQNVRAMIDKIRTLFTTVIQSIFGVFMNMVIEFERITIGIKDLVGKTVGIMVTMMYVMDGSIKTMNSTWNGPPGQMVRSLGKCFHPDTLVPLFDGRRIPMLQLEPGDLLSDGVTRVSIVMKIDNKDSKIPFFIIPSKSRNIYVTGSHFVYDSLNKRFIQVKDYHKACESMDYYSPILACLVTSTHHIPIDHELFWDWNDTDLMNY
jgi:hypothetical protein